MSSDQLRMQIQSLIQQANQKVSYRSTRLPFPTRKSPLCLILIMPGLEFILRDVVLLPAQANDTSVTLSGTSSFLQVADAPVSALFQEAQDGLDLTLKYHLPTGWKFSQSFPALPISLDFRTPFGAPQSSCLDLLTLTDPFFLLQRARIKSRKF